MYSVIAFRFLPPLFHHYNNSTTMRRDFLAGEKAMSDPGSVGAPTSGVVVEVRVKEGQEISKGGPVCGKWIKESII
jgi:biotin carboxyl carrier protein